MFSVVSRDFNMIGLSCKKEYALQVGQLAGKINGMVQDIPGFEYLFATQVNLFGRRMGKGVDIDIKGLDLSQIQQYAGRIQQQVRQLPGVLLVRSNLEMGKPELQIRLDHQRAADLGISTAEIATIVETLIAGKSASLYKIGGEEYDITLRGDKLKLVDEQALESVILYTSQGKPISLGSLVQIKKTSGPTKINHIEMDRSITLTVNIKEKLPLQEIIEQIENKVLREMRQELPYGYSLEISGSASDLEVSAEALKYSFYLAIVIVYLLMASLFESFIYPLIIMFSVPLATSGALLGVYLMETPLDVVTLLGFIILSGIVVNDAILLVHQALNHIRLEGMEPKQAILESCRTRLRPIFMTTVTTILGMLPLTLRGGAGSELYSGLGTAVIGGLTISTLFTLILVPVAFSLFIDLKQALGGQISRLG
jgi:HAE1 family hydrophobic/amphiphilic exporter-1